MNDTTLQIRIGKADKERIRSAAEMNGQDLSNFVRSSLLAAARAVEKRGVG